MRFRNGVRTAFAAFLAGLSVAAAAESLGGAPKNWWNPGWESRVPITVRARPGVLSTRPVVLRCVCPCDGDALGSVPLFRVRHGFRIVGLTVEDGQAVAAQYLVWGEDLARVAELEVQEREPPVAQSHDSDPNAK